MAHEIAHVQPRDHWSSWFELCVRLVHFWNPLFWFARRRFYLTAELACDQWVVERFPKAPANHVPRMYNVYSRQKDVSHRIWGHRFRRSRSAAIDWPWKLIHSSDGAHELYHLERDPHELRNLYATERDVASRLEQRLETSGEGAPRLLDEDEVPRRTSEDNERLRALGYVE